MNLTQVSVVEVVITLSPQKHKNTKTQKQWGDIYKGALLKFPYVTSTSPLFNVNFTVSPAQFGYHDYGGYLEGETCVQPTQNKTKQNKTNTVKKHNNTNIKIVPKNATIAYICACIVTVYVIHP